MTNGNATSAADNCQRTAGATMNTAASTRSEMASHPTRRLTAEAASVRLRQLARLPLLWPDDLQEVRQCVALCGEMVTVRRAELSSGRIKTIVFERVGNQVTETEI